MKYLIHIFLHRTEKNDFLTVQIPTISFLSQIYSTLGFNSNKLSQKVVKMS